MRLRHEEQKWGVNVIAAGVDWTGKLDTGSDLYKVRIRGASSYILRNIRATIKEKKFLRYRYIEKIKTN